jgi:hypothetical protein
MTSPPVETIIDAAKRAGDYQRFIQSSRGEWSVARKVYVQTRSGWFSTRTACYLAAGRPAVVQETGWSRFIPGEAGVIPFSTPGQAAEGLLLHRGQMRKLPRVPTRGILKLVTKLLKG